MADKIVADIKTQAPDHILVSGDLINIGLPQEYRAALAWLNTIGPPDRVSVVPGNHDAYLAAQATTGLALWSAFMTDDAFGRSLDIPRAATSGGPFPFVRQRGRLVIIGVNSGVETRLGSATGKVGDAQLTSLSRILKKARDLGLVRIVMIHHPPVTGLAPPQRALIDHVALGEVFACAGAELVLHGHNHTMTQRMHLGTPILGVASASARATHGQEPSARYHLITVDWHQQAPIVTVETRGLTEGDTIGVINRVTLPSVNHPDQFNKATPP